MKSVFLAGLLLLPATVFAQTPNITASSGGLIFGPLSSLNLSNGYSVVASNGVGYAMGDSVLLDCQLLVSNNAANVSNTVVIVDTSDDNITWQTGTFQILLANTGTTASNVRSNLNTQAAAFLRFSISNACVQTINTTNFATLKVNKKLYN